MSITPEKTKKRQRKGQNMSNPITKDINFEVMSTAAFAKIDDNFNIVKHRKAIYRTDTNDVFEFVGKGYKIIDHKSVINSINSIFEESKVSIRWNHFVEKSGARILSYVDVIDTKHVIKSTPVTLRLSFINSYDRTSSLKIHPFGVIGGNMIAIGDGVNAVHTKNVNVDSLMQSINESILTFKSKIDFWESLDSKDVDINDIIDVKTAIVDVLHIGQKQRKDMIHCTRESNTMWTLFRELSDSVCKMDVQESSRQRLLIKLAKYFEVNSKI